MSATRLPLDDDGYPTEEAERIVSEWVGSPFALMEAVKGAWMHADCGFWREENDRKPYGAKHQVIRRFHVSTAGWSGNESLINALESHWIFWNMFWVQTRVGGHYIFEISHDVDDLVAPPPAFSRARRLIAAAPELLEALKAVEVYRLSKPSPYATDHDCRWCNSCVDKMHNAIKSAIRKAEGAA